MNHEDNGGTRGHIAIHGHSYTIKEREDLTIVKNPIYEKCLPDDTVEYEILQDSVIITRIVSRKPKNTLTVVRGIRETGSFFCLPLICTIFNQEVNKEDFGEHNSKVGDMWTCSLTETGIKLLEYVGNAFNLRNVKDYIRNYIAKPEQNFSTLYSECFQKNLETPLYTHEFKDLTHLDTFSVDNCGTRDIDDCISIDFENGIIYIHIVDIVSGLEMGSEEDVKASYQGFTVYLPDAAITCLPHQMSESDLSLTVGKVRRVITVEIVIDRRDSTIHAAYIYPSNIINKLNYTYEEFDGKLPDIIDGKRSWVSKFIEKWWIKRLNLPNLKIRIRKGIVERVYLENTDDPAHRFIETLMVCTNSIVATYLRDKELTFPTKYGPTTLESLKIDEITDNKIVNIFIALEEGYLPKRRIINTGYFGLEINDYTHFTSPIRRQTDTIIHRLLAGYTYNKDSLQKLVNHLKEKKKEIDSIVEWYYSISIKKYLREIWKEPVTGWVTKIYPHGIDFIIPDWMLKGYIHVSKIMRCIRWKYNGSSLSGGSIEISRGTKISIFHEGIGIVNIKFTCIAVK